jgi:hypothetical protein
LTTGGFRDLLEAHAAAVAGSGGTDHAARSAIPAPIPDAVLAAEFGWTPQHLDALQARDI